MKCFTFLFLISLTITASLGQGHRKNRTKAVETDTIAVLLLSDSRELNTFWSDANEKGIMLKRYSKTKELHSNGIELTLIFNDWNSIMANKYYSIDSLEQLKTECRITGYLTYVTFEKAKGELRVLNSTDSKISIDFNITVLATDRRIFLVYKGQREFKRDY